MEDEHDVQLTDYDHDYENVDEDEIRDHGASLRVAVWIISSVIAVVMIALPVMRVLDWGGDGDDADASASEARAFVASRFAEAALDQRSPNAATRWAHPRLANEIESIIADLKRRSSNELSNASVFVARVACAPSVADGDECFHAWLRRPVASDFIRILIVVRIENGDAVVVDIERVNIV